MSIHPLVLFAVIGIMALQAGAVGWIWRRQREMEKRLHECLHCQQRQQVDISGLCAAAIRVDERLLELGRGIGEMHEWTQEMARSAGQEMYSYQDAIERIRQGATTDELVTECGLTREEAALLIRMHRNDD